MKTHNITLGSDPELMLFDRKQNRIVSSLAVLQCTKHNPIALPGGVKMYADNALVEAAFPPATLGTIVPTIGSAIAKMHKHLGKDYELVAKASHKFKIDDLNDHSLWESGCNPNSDAYTGEENPPANFIDTTRTGSFHIHLGYDKLNDMDKKIKFIKLLDAFLGCTSVVIDKDESSKARRKLYGRAGEFRPTPYGIEYRVLGPYMLGRPELVKIAYEIVHFTVGVFEHNHKLVVRDLEIQSAINENDKVAAEKIAMACGLPAMMMQRCKEIASEPEISLVEAWC